MVRRTHRGGNDPRLIGPGDEAIDPEDLEDEPEEDASADTSIEDLTVDEPDPGFDQPTQVSRSDIPFKPGQAPAIPRPWQGIPRIAVVYNLNYVYDPDAERWIKKTPTKADQFGDVLDPVLGIGQVGDPGVVSVNSPTIETNPSGAALTTESVNDPTLSTTIV